MRLCVAGSRTILDLNFVYDCINTVNNWEEGPITEIVSGTAIGPDSLGESWAKENQIACKLFPPNKKHGFPAALFIRNEEMAKYCDIGLLVWDGVSRGTIHMEEMLLKYKKPYWLVNYNSGKE